MSLLPHDLTDLYLSPVALELNARLSDFEGRTDDEVDYLVALRADRQPQNLAERRVLALRAVTHGSDLHGWEVEWVPRGLSMRNGSHELVLGIATGLRHYLDLETAA